MAYIYNYADTDSSSFSSIGRTLSRRIATAQEYEDHLDSLCVKCGYAKDEHVPIANYNCSPYDYRPDVINVPYPQCTKCGHSIGEHFNCGSFKSRKEPKPPKSVMIPFEVPDPDDKTT